MKNSNLIGILIVLLLSFFSVRMLMPSGFFPMHDDTQVARVFEMKKSLTDGMLPVRWVEDLGYGFGYPIFNFYAPLAYYVGGVTDLIINDSLLATKVMIAVGILLAGVFMYLLSKEFWGSVGGVVSAVLYVYAPYHALNVYVRGAVAETFGYAFVPLAFYGIYKCFTERKWKYVILGSLGFAGIITSHNLTAMMVTPFIVLLIIILGLISFRRKQLLATRYMLFAIFVGLLLAAFYWLPSLVEMKYTNVLSQVGGGADFKDHFVCPKQLWESNWGFGGSVPGCIDGLSFRIGKIHILLAGFVLLGLTLVKKNLRNKIAILFSAFIVLVSIFLMTSYSHFIWNTLSPMGYFQYPWRFLVLASAATSFAGGGVVWIVGSTHLKLFNKKASIALGSFLITIIIFFYAKLFVPQSILPVTSKELTNKEFINWNISKISDEYLPKKFSVPKSKSQLPTQVFEGKDITIQLSEHKTQSIVANVVSQNSQTIHANIAYFPAWTATVNEREAQLTKSPKGMSIKVPKGNSEVSLSYIETSIQKLGNLLSLSGFSILVLGIIMSRKRRLAK